MMIDIAEEDFNIPIRKKHVPELSKNIVKNNKKKITPTCNLLGVNRQMYYRAIQSYKNKQKLSKKVIDLVNTIRISMPRYNLYR